jgi:hypothetical protein
MTRKSFRTCVLLLGILIGTSSSAYADAVAITSVTLSNLQIVPTSGTVVFSAPQTIAHAVAVNGSGNESANTSEVLPRAEAVASVPLASASAVSDFNNLSIIANSNVSLSDCVCNAEAEGLAIIRASFMIAGGTGNVDVNISGLVQTVQDLVTDQFSLFAASDIDVTLKVADVVVFAFDPRLRIGFLDSQNFENQRQLSQIITLQFDQAYNLDFFIRANSRAAQNEIPEPATVVLLVSGLGFMAGFVKKRRVVPRE